MNFKSFKNNIDKEKIICKYNDDKKMLMDVVIDKIEKDEIKEYEFENLEVAILLIDGYVEFRWEENSIKANRNSVFDDEPTCLHVCKGIKVYVKAEEDSEILIQRTENNRIFENKIYTKEMITSDIFGDGVLNGTSRRIVRTIFDYNNAPYSNMVMGEVITYPGRWSSYPPHHHPQPEVYYYKFDKPQGFGFGLIGEEAFKIENESVAFIPGGLIHPQTAAPGYAMYYCWMIRHLDNNPWTERIDDEDHKWLLEKNINIWEGK